MTSSHHHLPEDDGVQESLAAKLFDAELVVPPELIERVVRQAVEVDEGCEDVRVGWRSTLPLAALVGVVLIIALAPRATPVGVLALLAAAVTYAGLLRSMVTDLGRSLATAPEVHAAQE